MNKEHGWLLKDGDGRFYSVDEDDFVDTPEEGCFFLFEDDAKEIRWDLLDDGETVEIVPATWDDGYVKEVTK